MESFVVTCEHCGKAYSFDKPLRLPFRCTCRYSVQVIPAEVKIFNVLPDEPIDCVHRDPEPIGIVNCGCAGKQPAYWCKMLEGHCTLTSTGKWWSGINTDEGKIDRVGKLNPCLHCKSRQQPPKYKYHPVCDTVAQNSKRAVCTVVIGDAARRNHDITRSSHEAYAKAHGADYVVLTGATQESPVFEKHRYKSVVEAYPEGTLCIDATDTFIMPDAPSVWDEVPDGFIGMTSDHELPNGQSLVDWGKIQVEIMAKLNNVEANATAMQTYHNSGVWFGRPEQAVYWNPPPVGFAGHWCDEETWCRNQMYSLGLKHYKLSERWNYTWSMDRGLARIEQVQPWIIHLAGMDNPSVPEDWKISLPQTRAALLRVFNYAVSASLRSKT